MQEEHYNCLNDEKLLSLYKDYTGISDRDELQKHFKSVYNKILEGGQSYKCIEGLRFTYSRLSLRFYYKKILEIGKNEKEPLMIDIGCCTGTDLRMLAWEGYPAEYLVGSDINGHFIDCGYDLFRDRDNCKITFFVGDVFDPEPSSRYHHRTVVVNAGSVIHLLNSAESIREFVQRIANLLRPGGMFVGSHMGADRSISVFREDYNVSKQYLSAEDFRKILEQEHFTDIEIRSHRREPHAEIKDKGFQPMWIQFCAVYKPPQ